MRHARRALVVAVAAVLVGCAPVDDGGAPGAGGPATTPSVEGVGAEGGGSTRADAEGKEARERRRARARAQEHLDYAAFSRSGLVDQLEFEGFTREVARHAVDSLDVEWTTQAVRAAMNYREFESYSRRGVVTQLVFEGYTRTQAEHGADAAGY
ncbi:Ltp family lipoprotein [Isoptericola sp. BMS4]|uniref:Ltp family lipoprotein n=1 Tax=Isoptericola sp. BMS4 TaxID=2527875 RepID=UPI00196B8312|nr:Ltp family lipoprotein [Isoptericola sp. BMS4]